VEVQIARQVALDDTDLLVRAKPDTTYFKYAVERQLHLPPALWQTMSLLHP
jgi:hypothetical protein